MTFHSFSNPTDINNDDYSDDSFYEDPFTQYIALKRRSNVINFVNNKKFKKAFKHIVKTEFPHLKNKYKNIKMTGITANTKNRNVILNDFDETEDDEIYILSSCRTIGEGIDTKKANMCVFVDPKQSYRDIIQNIGRILRKVKGCGKTN